jgi:stage III sporulation protein AH
MLITAGYLNFNANNSNTLNQDVVAEVGDASLVSANLEAENVQNVANVNETAANEVTEEAGATNEENIENTEQTTPTVSTDEYFVKSKLERDTMYSQMLETYQEVYNNSNSTAEEKTNAMKEIANINDTKNAVMIAENLVMAKGFEDLVIFVNSNSTSVIVKAEELTPEQIAQIQNIVSRELNLKIEEINISTK